MAATVYDAVYWEECTRADGTPGVRPRLSPLPVADKDEVLLGVPHLDGAGTVRLPPESLVQEGYPYGPNDSLTGELHTGAAVPIEENQYRVIGVQYTPGDAVAVVTMEKKTPPAGEVY